MSYKKSKLIIENAIQGAIDGNVIKEGPLDFAKSMVGGVKGAGQNVVGNFRTNRAKAYMDTFAKKTQKSVDSYAQKANKIAQKMQNSGNNAVRATGDKIAQEIDDTKQRVKDLSVDIEKSFPSSVAGGGGKSRSPDSGSQEVQAFRDWFKSNYDIPWDSIGKTSQKAVIDQYVASKQKKSSTKGLDDSDLEQKLKTKTTPPPKSSEPNKSTKITPSPKSSTTDSGLKQAPARTGQTGQNISKPPSPVPAAPKSTPSSFVGRKPILPASPPSGTMNIAKGPDTIPPAQSGTGAQTIGGRQAISPPPPLQAAEPKPIQNVSPRQTYKSPTPSLSLPDVGVQKDEFAAIDAAARSKNPHALGLMNAMKFGDIQGAEKHLSQLRKSLNEPTQKDGKFTKQVKKRKAKKQDVSTSPGKKKKISVDIPPEKSTSSLKKVIDKSIEKAVKDGDTEKSQKRNDKKAPNKEDEIDIDVEPARETQSYSNKKNKEDEIDIDIETPKESLVIDLGEPEPVVSMADFMANYFNDDPGQFEKIKQKIDQEKFLKHKKCNKKRNLIIDRSMKKY